MSDVYELIVLFWVMPDQFDALDEYVRQVHPIMVKHGGSFVTVMEPTVLLGWDEPQPHQAHVLRFPSQADFEAYRGDPELELLIPLRDRAVRRAVTVAGRQIDRPADDQSETPQGDAEG